MIRNDFITRLLILLIFTATIAGGASDGWWSAVGSAQAGNRSAPFGPAIDDGARNETSMPTALPKPGYQWVLRRMPINETDIVADGYRLERQPRYIEKWEQIGWTEKKVAVYDTVTQNKGWEYYTVEVPEYKTVSYVKYYKPVLVLRNGVIESSGGKPVYGSKRIQIGTRKETHRRPRWVTHQEFSHYKIVREPEYGWVRVQDGWEEPKVVSNFVSKKVPGSALIWLQEPMLWQPGTIPDWLPEPDWLAADERPPWISETLWHRLPLDDREAILREARGAWRKMLKRQISSDGDIAQNLPRELFESLRPWEGFPREMWVTVIGGIIVRDMPSADYGTQIGALRFRRSNIEWTGKIHIEQTDGRIWYQILYISAAGPTTGWVPEEHVARYVDSGTKNGEPLNPARETYGYHDGKDAWSHYLNPESSAAQYLKLAYLFAAVGDMDYSRYTDELYNPHLNLCGELAVMEAVGISLEAGLKKFRDYVSAGILRDMEATTSYVHLQTFFEAFGWNSAFYENDDYGARLKNEVSNGHAVVALVTIDNQQGEVSENGNTAHWVGIKSIEDGEVKIYNPFTNKIEIYDWADFRAAWAQTPQNESEYLLITAEQPDG